MKKTDGNFVWCRLDTGIILSPSGEAKRAVSYITDISAIKQNTEYLENQTQIDPLTGLYNKRATEALSNKILTDFPGAHHALIMLDIDNFKGVNDTLGHAFGDSVLVETSGAFKALFRSDDIVGRIGGEEFLIALPDITLAEARGIAERLGEIIRNSAIVLEQDIALFITVSIGLAFCSASAGKIASADQPDNDAVSQIIARADHALLASKSAGRNKITISRSAA